MGFFDDELDSALQEQQLSILDKRRSDLFLGGSTEQEANIFGAEIGKADTIRLGAFLGGASLGNLAYQEANSEAFNRIRVLRDDILQRQKFGLEQDKFGLAQDKFGLDQDKFGQGQYEFGQKFGLAQDKFGLDQDKFGQGQYEFDQKFNEQLRSTKVDEGDRSLRTGLLGDSQELDEQKLAARILQDGVQNKQADQRIGISQGQLDLSRQREQRQAQQQILNQRAVEIAIMKRGKVYGIQLEASQSRIEDLRMSHDINAEEQDGLLKSLYVLADNGNSEDLSGFMRLVESKVKNNKTDFVGKRNDSK